MFDDSKPFPKIVALVPMRHLSERIPGKNFRLFLEKPLFYYILTALSDCNLIAEIVVDTDSPVVKEGISTLFPHVTLIERPGHLRDVMVSMNDVLLHDVRKVDADFYLQTHSTNPLLTSATISDAIHTFLENQYKYDSLFSVTKIQSRLWDRHNRALNHNPALLLRTQDLQPIYQENSCLYIFSGNMLEARKNRIGDRPLMFEINRIEAWDIDEEADFLIAEFLYSKYNKKDK